jgi:N-acetyl-anhydromuramyl-L-alanine amidase AmpD
VNVASNTANIEYDEEVFDFEELNKELEKYGYEIEMKGEKLKTKDKNYKNILSPSDEGNVTK